MSAASMTHAHRVDEPGFEQVDAGVDGGLRCEHAALDAVMEQAREHFALLS